MSETLADRLLTVYVLATVLPALGGAWLVRQVSAALLGDAPATTMAIAAAASNANA